MKKNGYQEFDERENLKRARELNMQLLEEIRVYNAIPEVNLEKRIEVLEKIIDVFDILKLEAFDIDENAYKKFQEKLKYLKYKRDYIKEYDVETYDVNEIKKRAKKDTNDDHDER